MVALFGSQIYRRIIVVLVIAMIGMPMPAVMGTGNRCRRMLATMRGNRPGMETRQDHRHKTKEDNTQTHAEFVSEARELWLASAWAEPGLQNAIT